VNSCVLDASVLIAVAKGEQYDAALLPAIDGGIMSAVNFAEVITKLIDLGVDPGSQRVQAAFSLLDAIEPFTEVQGRIAGELRRLGKNVALGDRACMALAIDLGTDLYTAEHVWASYNIGVKIHLIR
jgi:ribonuclease VapC